eukprot:snap_masked-scaffold_16-processed-gene-2.11-mRNA-1 protein AED:1.00 eAED:1.00 QI:0/0/0/0/1/1/2/0/61
MSFSQDNKPVEQLESKEIVNIWAILCEGVKEFLSTLQVYARVFRDLGWFNFLNEDYKKQIN